MTQDFGVMIVVVLAGWTATEELLAGQELLVHLEAAHEADPGVVGRGHLAEQGQWVEEPRVGDGEFSVHVHILC